MRSERGKGHNDGTHVDLRVDYQYDAWGDRVATSTDTDGDGYAPLLSEWANSVVGFSSQANTTGLAAAHTTGVPDGSSWPPRTGNAGEYLEVGFATAGVPTA